jgi:hypothetical protein
MDGWIGIMLDEAVESLPGSGHFDQVPVELVTMDLAGYLQDGTPLSLAGGDGVADLMDSGAPDPDPWYSYGDFTEDYYDVAWADGTFHVSFGGDLNGTPLDPDGPMTMRTRVDRLPIDGFSIVSDSGVNLAGGGQQLQVLDLRLTSRDATPPDVINYFLPWLQGTVATNGGLHSVGYRRVGRLAVGRAARRLPQQSESGGRLFCRPLSSELRPGRAGTSLVLVPHRRHRAGIAARFAHVRASQLRWHQHSARVWR